MQFTDKCLIELKAGNGGDGIVAWRREAHYPEGGPWGGDGGNGGSIILIGDHNVNSFFHLKNKKIIVAKNGNNGESKLATGKSANDLYIKVPLGTSIYDNDTNELIQEILQDKQECIVCLGGRGGHGNAFFKSSKNKAPSLFERGDIGEKKNIRLELRYIADIGIIGFPNAGKSSLLSKISNAKPKIANYQFTTLVPVFGTVKNKNQSLVFADIPGLIEGASSGKGLGFDFLKHIERCLILIHLISIEDNDLKSKYDKINEELMKYNPSLLTKKTFVVLNKMDLKHDQKIIKQFEKEIKQGVYCISTKDSLNINELLNKIFLEYDKINSLRQSMLSNKDNIKVIKVIKEKQHDQEIKVINVDENTWRIESEFLKYWSHKIPLTTNDNIIRYNQKLLTVKVEEKAKQNGAKKGDTMLIYANEFTID